MHFPSDRAEDWFRQLVAEVKVTRYANGVPFSRFENPSKARNEALDLRVYANAALGILQPVWKKLAAAHAAPLEAKPTAPDIDAGGGMKSTRAPRRARGGFASNW
jgi:phage terminase large subunit GpA-like protein